jgi:hypothetical protein
MDSETLAVFLLYLELHPPLQETVKSHQGRAWCGGMGLGCQGGPGRLWSDARVCLVLFSPAFGWCYHSNLGMFFSHMDFDNKEFFLKNEDLLLLAVFFPVLMFEITFELFCFFNSYAKSSLVVN